MILIDPELNCRVKQCNHHIAEYDDVKWYVHLRPGYSQI